MLFQKRIYFNYKVDIDRLLDEVSFFLSLYLTSEINHDSKDLQGRQAEWKMLHYQKKNYKFSIGFKHLFARDLTGMDQQFAPLGENRNKIRTRVSAGASSSLNPPGTKDLLLTETENCLIIWIEDCNRKNIPLNIYLLRQKKRLFVILVIVFCAFGTYIQGGFHKLRNTLYISRYGEFTTVITFDLKQISCRFTGGNYDACSWFYSRSRSLRRVISYTRHKFVRVASHRCNLSWMMATRYCNIANDNLRLCFFPQQISFVFNFHVR